MSELVAEQPQASDIPANPPLQRFNHRKAFTPESARAAQAKAAVARKENHRQDLAKIEQLQAELTLAKPIILATTAKLAAIALTPDDEYRLTRLARTREQIEQLDEQLSNSSDPKEIKSLADALARLTDIEFALAKRPKPAAYRTAPEKLTKRSSVVELED